MRNIHKLWGSITFKGIIYMVITNILFYGITLSVLKFIFRIDPRGGSWGGVAVGILYWIAILIYSIIYGIVFAVKKQNIILVCVIYFLFTAIGVVVLNYIFYADIINFQDIVGFIFGSFLLTIIPLVLSFVTKVSMKCQDKLNKINNENK